MKNYPVHRLRGKQFVILLLSLAFSSYAFPQSLNPKMDKLTEQLDQLAIKSPLELIYLQTNKDLYETGGMRDNSFALMTAKPFAF